MKLEKILLGTLLATTISCQKPKEVVYSVCFEQETNHTPSNRRIEENQSFENNNNDNNNKENEQNTRNSQTQRNTTRNNNNNNNRNNNTSNLEGFVQEKKSSREESIQEKVNTPIEFIKKYGKNITSYLNLPQGTYIIKEDISLKDIHIKAGTTFLCDKYTSITFTGTVKAEGTSNKPIIFKSRTGAWQGLIFKQGSGSSILNHIKVTEVDGSKFDAAISIGSANIKISNSSISRNSDRGFSITESKPELKNIIISNCGVATSKGGAIRMHNSTISFGENNLIASCKGIVSGIYYSGKCNSILYYGAKVIFSNNISSEKGYLIARSKDKYTSKSKSIESDMTIKDNYTNKIGKVNFND